MELFLVKEQIKILPLSEVISETKEYNILIRDLEIKEQGNIRGLTLTEWSIPSWDDAELKRNRILVTLSDLPVTFSSVCSDVSEDKDLFRKKVKKLLEQSNAEKIKLELVICNNDRNTLDGYFILSGFCNRSSKLNVFQRLENEFNIGNVKFSVQLSLAHLPTENAAVSPKSLVNLRMTSDDLGTYYLTWEYKIGNKIPVRVPRKMTKWWGRGTTTGYIYSKLSIKVILDEKAVDLVYGCSNTHERFLMDKDFTDLEIICKNGEIVKCHRTFLAAEYSPNGLFRRRFTKMLDEGQAGPWKLRMEISKIGVEAFLEYVYCGRVGAGVTSCDVALELLKVAVKYQVIKLEYAMDEIIMAKESTDFGYFSVGGTVNLFLFARNVRSLDGLKDKSVRVLKNYLKMKSEDVLESKVYQDLFKNQPDVAMELSKLYIQP